MNSRYDVVVVGAGPAGSMAAYQLARLGWTVALLDRSRFPRDKACGDGLTRIAVRQLQAMGLGDRLAGLPKITGVRVCKDFSNVRERRYDPEAMHGGYALAVPRRDLDDWMRLRASQEGAHFRDGVAVLGPHWDGDRVAGVVIQAGETREILHARFVVAADGANSQFARQAGLLDSGPAGLSFAVRSYYRNPAPLGDRFEVYFPIRRAATDQSVVGYGWVFPLEGEVVNAGVGFMPFARDQGKLSLRHLQSSFVDDLSRNDPRFEHMVETGSLLGAPLRHGLDPDRCSAPGVLLAGDAASLSDPLTGEGIGSALESGSMAAEVLDGALRRNREDLRDYNAWLGRRYRDRVKGRHDHLVFSFLWKLVETTFDTDLALFNTAREMISEPDRAPWSLPTPKGFEQDLELCRQLEAVRDELLDAIQASVTFLASVCLSLVDPDACALRATLAVLAGRIAGGPPDRALKAARIVELGFLSYRISLDVQESGEGVENAVTILAADYFAARAHAISAELGCEATRLMGEAASRVWRGRLRELLEAAPAAQTSCETNAASFQLAARLAAAVCGGSVELANDLAAFGEALGLVYHPSEPESQTENRAAALQLASRFASHPELATLVAAASQNPNK